MALIRTPSLRYDGRRCPGPGVGFMVRLGVNIDHVATVRQARGAVEVGVGDRGIEPQVIEIGDPIGVDARVGESHEDGQNQDGDHRSDAGHRQLALGRPVRVADDGRIAGDDEAREDDVSHDGCRVHQGAGRERHRRGVDGGKYCVLFDPLDGSSNIDFCVGVGTIFSVLRNNPDEPGADETVCQPGTSQVAAGYILYGSSVVFVLTTGSGVDMFVLDQSIGSFVLVEANIRDAVNRGLADYTPVFLSQVPGLFQKKLVPVDVALIQTSLPDEHGFMSLGISVDITKAATENAPLVIAQINPRMPRVLGETFIHIEDAAEADLRFEIRLPRSARDRIRRARIAREPHYCCNAVITRIVPLAVGWRRRGFPSRWRNHDVIFEGAPHDTAQLHDHAASANRRAYICDLPQRAAHTRKRRELIVEVSQTYLHSDRFTRIRAHGEARAEIASDDVFRAHGERPRGVVLLIDNSLSLTLKDRRLVTLSYPKYVSGSGTFYGPVGYTVANHAGQAEGPGAGACPPAGRLGPGCAPGWCRSGCWRGSPCRGRRRR